MSIVFKVTLCNTDLESQELNLNDEHEAKEIADRLRRFLPDRLIHAIILEKLEYNNEELVSIIQLEY